MIKDLIKRSMAIELMTIELDAELRQAYKGKRLEVIDPYYNGQPCGTSKKSKLGKIYNIRDASSHSGDVIFHIETEDTANILYSKQVKLLEEPNHD